VYKSALMHFVYCRMNISSGFVSTSKTARYFSLGELSPNTQEIWIVLHGYAQLASDFIKPFDAIASAGRFIVAPEGLNRFYAKGFGGKPAATWMTSESREEEIGDYINYLNTLCEALNIRNHHAKIVLLGFSQGVATATRWLHQTNIVIDRLVIYSGEVAAELQDPVSPKLLDSSIVYITGTNDKLISAEKLDVVKLFMKSLNATMIEFEGGHEVKEDVLLRLV
jgi:predicted esterase